MDGAAPVTVTLTGSTTLNRVIAWNSTLLSATTSHRHGVEPCTLAAPK